MEDRKHQPGFLSFVPVRCCASDEVCNKYTHRVQGDICQQYFPREVIMGMILSNIRRFLFLYSVSWYKLRGAPKKNLGGGEGGRERGGVVQLLE